MSAFFYSAVLMVLYLLNVVNTLKGIPWNRIESFCCAFWAIFILITSVMVLFEDGNLYVLPGVSPSLYINRNVNKVEKKPYETHFSGSRINDSVLFRV